MPRPRKISRRVERLWYVREDDGAPYVHDFGPGAELWTERDGSVSIRNPGGQWAERGGRRWLVNPRGRAGRQTPKGGKTMARRMPRRNAKGRFVKGGGGSRRRRRRSAPRAAAKRTRRRRRRNPGTAAAPRRSRSIRRVDVLDRIMTAGQDALAITAGQAVVRLVPRFLPLPTGGPVGLAVSTATAILAGIAAERFVSRDTARFLTAGAISIPLQQALAQYVAPAVPLVGTALGLGRYPRFAGYSRANRVAAAGRNGGGRLRGYAYPMAGFDFASAAAVM